MTGGHFAATSGGSRGSSSDAKLKMKCFHAIEATVRTCKKQRNVGRRFHCCPLWPVSIVVTY